MDLLYKKVLADDKLQGYFEGIDVERLKKHQKSFFTVAFGGGELEADGHALRKVHARPAEQGISDAEFDRFANHLETSLAEVKVSRELIGEALQIIDGLRAQVLNR